MTSRDVTEPCAPRKSHDERPAGAELSQLGKDAFEIGLGAGIQNVKRYEAFRCRHSLVSVATSAGLVGFTREGLRQ